MYTFTISNLGFKNHKQVQYIEPNLDLERFVKNVMLKSKMFYDRKFLRISFPPPLKWYNLSVCHFPPPVSAINTP